ncbi:hypothetical protein MASR2M8_12980 [Opitutaceae bacterium]
MDKSALRSAILRQLEADLALQKQAALTSREEATSEESKAENKYDTRGQEAAYLAEGQARLVAEIQESIAIYAALPLPAFGHGDPIALGAVITLRAAGHEQTCFLGPRAGGLELTLEGCPLLVLTPASPLGRLLLGRRVGETVVPPTRGKPVTHTITAVI